MWFLRKEGVSDSQIFDLFRTWVPRFYIYDLKLYKHVFRICTI